MNLEEQKKDVEQIINQAICKINGKDDNDVCKYIPGPKGGYIHHFTFRKIQQDNPEQCIELIKKFILNPENPKVLDPRKRAPRSLSRKECVHFTHCDIERVLELAKLAGDDDLVTRFNPKRSLPLLKRDLMRSIRKNKINEELWIAYSEVMSSLQAAQK